MEVEEQGQKQKIVRGESDGEVAKRTLREFRPTSCIGIPSKSRTRLHSPYGLQSDEETIGVVRSRKCVCLPLSQKRHG